MMQQLRAFTQRANAAAARVVDAAFAPLGNGIAGTATNGTTALFTGTAWNMPSVHATAICTHGKRYERRLQEMLT